MIGLQLKCNVEDVTSSFWRPKKGSIKGKICDLRKHIETKS